MRIGLIMKMVAVLVLSTSLANAQDDFDLTGGTNDGNSAGQGIRSRRSTGGSSSGSRSTSSNNSGDRFSGSQNSSSRYSNQSTDVDSNRYSKRRDSTRNRNSNQRGSASGSKTPVASPGANGKKLSTVKGKTPAPKKSSGGGGESRTATNVAFTMHGDPATNLLYIESMTHPPSMNILAEENKEFGTRVAFRNARNGKFQHLRIALKYDSALMEPVGIDDSAIQPLLEEPADATVDSRRGIISYRAKFQNARGDELMTLFKVQWKALQPTSNSPLTFLNTPEHPSTVLNPEGENLLLQKSEDNELEVSENTGLLDSGVAIVPSGKTAEEMEYNDSGLTAIQLANNISEGTAEGGMVLALKTRNAAVATGSEFLVDIVYSNPNRAEMDLVKVNLKFDPKVLEAVDYDTDNWITRGINVHDGNLHEELPFDYHLRNEASNERGIIRYEMGFSSRARVPSGGTLATIKFRAISPAQETEIAFDVSENDRDTATSVSFLGFNLIGKPGERQAYVRNAAISIN